MKKYILISLSYVFFIVSSKAQPAMQFTGLDCNGNSVDLFADLDSGKAVILFFYMPNCGACPPPAQKIQMMANDINAEFPDFVKGYAFPFNNTTDCAASIDWAFSSSVDHFFMPMDSGETMVAYYGGFGMPSVVIVGGLDHRTMFFTMSLTTSDTAVMADSIRALYGELNSINDLPNNISSFDVFPNPASEMTSMSIELKETTHLFAEVTDMTGKHVALLLDERLSGLVTKRIETSGFSNGFYTIRLIANGKTVTRRITVKH